MELRSRNRTLEFQALHSSLTELGLYEKGMDLAQMRQIMGAVDESINETSLNDQDMELALRESERDFAYANMCNSTMIGLCENTNVALQSSSFDQCQRNFGSFSSPYSSTELGYVERIIVKAEVHHELNWTPKISSPCLDGETKRLSRKRNADAISQEDSGIILSSNSLFETTSL